MDQKLTLFELNQLIKDALVSAIPGTVWVVAEISELKENRNGHCYLELVEKKENEIVAREKATIWSYTYRILKPYFETSTGQLFSHGIKVLVQVSVEFHPAFGLSLNIKDIDPTYTVGDMALQRKKIIDRLQNEGIFDMNKELSLPLVPQNIAVISSQTAAGYQDFMEQLNANARGFKFYTKLFNATMQGENAVPSIISALEQIFQNEDFFDAVVIIRGGGATADLGCFDNYDLAFNVAQFPLPVVTGIGHEKDDTIIDLVAHTRMKTPTAAAEFFISGAAQFFDRLMMLENDIVQLTRDAISLKQDQLNDFADSLKWMAGEFIDEKTKFLVRKSSKLHKEVSLYSYNKKFELNNIKHDLFSAVSVWKVATKNTLNRPQTALKRLTNKILEKERDNFSRVKYDFIYKTNKYLAREKERISLNGHVIRLLNPENILKRGFTITSKDGKIMKSVVPLQSGDTIETRFADGKTESKIIKKQ